MHKALAPRCGGSPAAAVAFASAYPWAIAWAAAWAAAWLEAPPADMESSEWSASRRSIALSAACWQNSHCPEGYEAEGCPDNPHRWQQRSQMQRRQPR